MQLWYCVPINLRDKMFSHHSLIRSRTNHLQKSILPGSKTIYASSIAATADEININQKNKLKTSEINQSLSSELVHSCQPWISNTKISTVFFLFLYLHSLYYSMFRLLLFLCVISFFVWFNDFAIVIRSSHSSWIWKKVTL